MDTGKAVGLLAVGYVLFMLAGLVVRELVWGEVVTNVDAPPSAIWYKTE